MSRQPSAASRQKTQAGGGSKLRQSATAAGALPDRRSSTPHRAPGADTFFLTPPERSFGGEIRPLAGRAGTDEAIAAAKAGDAKAVDELELRWLNAWGPRPTVEQLTGRDDDSLGVVAAVLYRAPGGPVIEWWVVKVTCWLCFGKNVRHRRCRDKYCDGSGYDGFDDALVFYTDADLNLVELP